MAKNSQRVPLDVSIYCMKQARIQGWTSPKIEHLKF